MVQGREYLTDDIFESWEKIIQPGVIHDGEFVLIANEDFTGKTGS